MAICLWDIDFDFAILFGNNSQPISKATRLTIEILNFDRTIREGKCPRWVLDEFLELIFHPENYEECSFISIIPPESDEQKSHENAEDELRQEKKYLKNEISSIFGYDNETLDEDGWEPPQYLQTYIANVKKNVKVKFPLVIQRNSIQETNSSNHQVEIDDDVPLLQSNSSSSANRW